MFLSSVSNIQIFLVARNINIAPEDTTKATNKKVLGELVLNKLMLH
jgi:hypothetical protein